MKKILILMISVAMLFAFSCSTNSGLYPETETQRKVYRVENIPKILSAGFSREIEETLVTPLDQVESGESVYMFVAVRDSGFDASRIEVTASHDDGPVETQIIKMNRADGEEFIYGVDVSFKAAGMWKFTFRVFDEDENQSEPFNTSLEVVEK